MDSLGPCRELPVHGYAPSVGSGTGYDGAYQCDKPTHVPRNSLWSRVGEGEAASVEVEVARENHRAAVSPLSGNRINCQFCITEHSSEPRGRFTFCQRTATEAPRSVNSPHAPCPNPLSIA